jgi:hypothetical protein
LRKGSKSSRGRAGGGGKSRRKKASVLKILLFVIAAAVIPFSASLVIHTPVLFSAYTTITTHMLYAAGGFVLFLALFSFFGAPVKSYILEHELSHVVFALLSGVRVRSISMKSSNSYVRTDRINIIIALAPYSLPLYTVILVAMYRLLCMLTKSAVIAAVFYILFGITLSFHFVATIHYVQLEQPDLKRYGYFSSLVFIATWSYLIITLIFRLIFTEIQLASFLEKSLRETYVMYTRTTAMLIRFLLDNSQ